MSYPCHLFHHSLWYTILVFLSPVFSNDDGDDDDDDDDDDDNDDIKIIRFKTGKVDRPKHFNM